MDDKKLKSLKMRLFFTWCVQNLGKRSEISGTPIPSTMNNLYYHHVFSKSTHPELAYCTDNIMIVTADEHALLNNNDNYYEQVLIRKEFISSNLDEMKEKSVKFEKKIETLILARNELFNKK